MHLAVQNESEAKVGKGARVPVARRAPLPQLISSLSQHKGAISNLHSGTGAGGGGDALLGRNVPAE